MRKIALWILLLRKINVNNYRRNLIKSRLGDVICRSDALRRKSHCVTSGKKEDLGSAGLATELATGSELKCRRSRKNLGQVDERIHDEYETGMR